MSEDFAYNHRSGKIYNQTLKRLLTPFVRTVDSRDAARKSNLCTTPLALKSLMDFFRSGDETSMAKPRLIPILLLIFVQFNHIGYISWVYATVSQ